jgi:Thiolase, C-terminal domain
MIAGRQAGVHQAWIRDACEIRFLCLKFLPWPRKILSLGEKGRYGLETMCIGGGQGMAAIFETA